MEPTTIDQKLIKAKRIYTWLTYALCFAIGIEISLSNHWWLVVVPIIHLIGYSYFAYYQLYKFRKALRFTLPGQLSHPDDKTIIVDFLGAERRVVDRVNKDVMDHFKKLEADQEQKYKEKIFTSDVTTKKDWEIGEKIEMKFEPDEDGFTDDAIYQAAKNRQKEKIIPEIDTYEPRARKLAYPPPGIKIRFKYEPYKEYFTGTTFYEGSQLGVVFDGSDITIPFKQVTEYERL